MNENNSVNFFINLNKCFWAYLVLFYVSNNKEFKIIKLWQHYDQTYTFIDISYNFKFIFTISQTYFCWLMLYHRRCNKCILEFTFILITHINLLVTRIKRSAFAFLLCNANHTYIYFIEPYSDKYNLHHGITIHPEHTLTLLRFYNPYQELDFLC